jgi:hypothetical protein
VVAGRTLYLHFSVFVAETLAHMAYEERVVQPLLERTFSAAQLQAIHFAIVSSIPSQEMMQWLRAMIPATDRARRAEMVANVRANAPPPMVAALLDDLQSRLSPRDFADLQNRLGQ